MCFVLAQKPGTCPPERYYIKASNPDIIHNFCHSDDFQCKNNMKCCSDNLHMICKPPAQGKTMLPRNTTSTTCSDIV